MEINTRLPTHVQFLLPIIEALQKAGGSAGPSELKNVLVGMLKITEDELGEKLKTGCFRIDNQIIWSKKYLVRDGLLDVSDSSVWRLTEDGLSRRLTEEDVLGIFRSHRKVVAS